MLEVVIGNSLPLLFSKGYMKLKLQIIKLGMVFRIQEGMMCGIISDINLKYPFPITIVYKINRMMKWKD